MYSRSGLGAAAIALAGAAMLVAQPMYLDHEPRRPAKRRFPRPPEQTGPVVDTTPESKRAKRRRLARQQGGRSDG